MGANSYIGLEKEIYDKRSETKLYSGNEIDSLKKYMVGSQMLYFTNSTFLGQGPWNRLIKNELAKKVNFNTNLKIGEDIVWNYELMKNSKRICVVNRCWYLYYINPSSASRRYRSDAINESKKSLIEIKKYLNLSNDEEYKAYCSRCLSDLKRIYYTYLSFPNNKSRDDVKILYTNPWSEAKSVKYFRLCSKKQKVVAMLYKLNLLFLYYRMKSFFKK